MSDASLGPSSFIVLGFLAQHGPATSYELKRWADQSVGNFWTFPRSQLYAEPQRLVGLGLISESQEDDGRRRRLYTTLEAGRQALQTWLKAPAGTGELRDPGLLKLHFSAQGPEGTAQALAAEQLALHRARLADYQAMQRSHPESGASLTLGMGLRYEAVSVDFWEEILAGEQASSEG